MQTIKKPERKWPWAVGDRVHDSTTGFKALEVLEVREHELVVRDDPESTEMFRNGEVPDWKLRDWVNGSRAGSLACQHQLMVWAGIMDSDGTWLSRLAIPKATKAA